VVFGTTFFTSPNRIHSSWLKTWTARLQASICALCQTFLASNWMRHEAIVM